MNAARKILIFGGMVLALVGMLYGLYYGLFAEHQALEAMGGSLASGFASAASGHLAEANTAINDFGATKYDYVRQVDVHSHWIGLAMLMIVLGVVFDSASLGERAGIAVALAFLGGSVVFPLGVILQTVQHGSTFASALAISGSALVSLALAALALGFMRQHA